MRSGVVILAGLACLLPRAGLALEANEIFKRADPSIVVISVTDKNGKDLGLGSGVLVAPRDVVTNCHVVKDAVGIAVKQTGVQRSAKLRYQDTARDLCQIQLDDSLPNGKPVSSFVLSAKLEVGQPVFAIGAPQGLDRTISRGIISALRDMKENAKLIQTDTSVTRGSSGGGLFDSEARLIGIVTFGIGEEGNLNFAIPADWIEQLATRNRDRSADADPAMAAVGAGKSVAGASDAPASGMPRIGDRWKYRLLDGKQAVGTVVVEIMDARGRMLNERITRQDQKGFLAERNVVAEVNSAKFQDIVTLPGGYQLAEIAPYVPLRQEVTASQLTDGLPVTLLLGGYGYGKQKFQTESRVMGREKVQVPAGTFDAVRVQVTGRKSIASDFVKVICNYWYSPDSMRTVKMSLEIKYSNTAFQSNTETYELIAFESAR